jgi:hypothetical protein
VQISDVVVSNTDPRYASILSGIPGHKIEDVKLNNITILHQGGGTRQEAAIQLAEKETGYPEPNMFGVTPSYGFFVRHVKGLEMTNVEVRYEKEDWRPVFALHDVQGADFIHIKADHAPQVPVFALNQVSDFNLDLSRPLPDTHLGSVGKKEI